MSKRKRNKLSETENKEENKTEVGLEEETSLEDDLDSSEIVSKNTTISDKNPDPIMIFPDAIRELMFQCEWDWVPSIRRRGELMGFDCSKSHPKSKWIELFVAWGGHGVLK